MEHPARVGSRVSRLLTAALALTLFFIVVGAKWAVVDRFGSDIPNWDQWDAEGLHLLIPWFEHGDMRHEFFVAHNEHRIVLTKLQNLAVILAGGQWDARVECVINALLHAGIAVALWLTGRRWLAARWQAPWFVLIAALFGLPFAWENILGGFHSQQYWLLGLSFAAIAALPFAPPWRPAWWAAAAAAALALLTMGSGFFAAAVVLVVAGLRVVRGDSVRRHAWPLFALAVAIVIVGVLTRVEVAGHARLKASSMHEFLLYCLRSLQWPWRRDAWLAALLWFPWGVAAWRAFRSRDPHEARIAQTIGALGGWVLLQILATAYSRGAGADFPAARYQDTVAFGLAVNGLALGWLLAPPSSSAKNSVTPLFAVLGAAWFVAVAWGLGEAAQQDFKNDLPNVRAYYRNAEDYTRGYIATNDPAQLAFEDVPYPTDGLIDRLSHPALRTLLPQSVRLALPLRPAAPPNDVFLENNASQLHLPTEPRRGLAPATPPLPSRLTWGSFNAAGVAATGEWTSAPLTASLGGWLVFATAGQIGETGIALELHDAQTHALLANVRPSKVPGNVWRAAYVRAPRQPFVVVARDNDTQGWLAFSAPAEMSSLSYLGWQAAKNGLLIVYISGGAAALLGLSALALQLRSTGPDRRSAGIT